jgi:DNA-damage-inducible protein J
MRATVSNQKRALKPIRWQAHRAPGVSTGWPLDGCASAEVKERATAVLDNIGLTVDAAAHDAWFRAKVQEAVGDPRPVVPHEKVEAHFAKRRAAALLKAGQGKA